MAEADGYLQVLVANESDRPVWFDWAALRDVSYQIEPTMITQETQSSATPVRPLGTGTGPAWNEASSGGAVPRMSTSFRWCGIPTRSCSRPWPSTSTTSAPATMTPNWAAGTPPTQPTSLPRRTREWETTR